MEGGLPLLNYLWQQALTSFCSSENPPNSSKWVYAVFWRILPRNFPPPRILVWEDGFCDFCKCERVRNASGKASFGPEIFFKMSHEVYNYGEGLMGKVASDNSHKWVFKELPTETDPHFFSSWNASLDAHPKAWELQFNSGIQVAEDLNLVINIQRKFHHLQSIPGIFAMQRPHRVSSEQSIDMLKHNQQISEISVCSTRLGCKKGEEFASNSVTFDGNGTMKDSIFQSIPPLLPSMSYSLGMLLSRLPSVPPNSHAQSLSSARNDVFQVPNFTCSYSQNSNVKLNMSEMPESKTQFISPYSSNPCKETAFLQEFNVQGEEPSNITPML